jgi:phosphoglycolate phosphatase-like HAD superfamily hydrolase
MKAIIFNFDGTLVDSAPSILASLDQAFADCGQRPLSPMTASLIDPPLRATLAGLYNDFRIRPSWSVLLPPSSATTIARVIAKLWHSLGWNRCFAAAPPAWY